MNKKLFASAILTVAAFFANAAFAVGYTNSVNDTTNYSQGANAQVAAGGTSVRANDLIITAQSSGLTADIPAGSKIIVRLPEGLNFDGAPSYMVTTGSPSGLTLIDDTGFGDPTRDKPMIELFDTNADGGMDRAVVTVASSGEAGDKLTISANVKSPAGTKAATKAKASVIVNNGLAVTQEIADIVDALPETVAGIGTLETAPSVGANNVVINTATIVVTIPAGTLGSSTVTITPGSGIKWSSAGTNVVAMTTHSPVAAGYVPLAVLNAGAASGTNTITLKTPGSGPLSATKFDIQVKIQLDQLNVSAGATGGRGVVIAGTAGVAGNANLIDVKLNGSAVMLTSTKVIPSNKVNDIVAGSNAMQTLPALDVTENFATDAVGPAGTATLTITAASGLKFAATGSQTVTVTGGTLAASPTVTSSIPSAQNVLTLTFASRDAAKLVRISGILATATSAATGNLSVTVGGATDKSTAPKASVVVAKAVAVGTVTSKLGDKKKQVTGPTGSAGAVTSTITLTESTYGSLTTAASSQVENAYFSVTPSTGSTIQAVTVTAKNYPATSPAASCAVENIPNSTKWICLVSTESTALLSGTSTISVAVNYYGNKVNTTPGSPPAAVVGSSISMTFGGNAGVSGSVDVADVVISTELSRGAVPDLTPGDTEAQALATLTISELFSGAITTGGNFRLIAPAGVTFNNADNVITSANPATAITTTPTITATFSPNDTLVINVAVASSTISFTPRGVIGPDASGFLSFLVANGDIDGKSGANVTAESINLAYADGTLAPFKVGDAVALNVGFSATNMLTGGLPPYMLPATSSSDSTVATATMNGSTVTILAKGVGNATITVMDSLDNPKTIDVTVTAGATQPVSTIIKKTDGTTSAATFSSGASKDGGASFAEEFTTADDVTLVGTINVDPADQGVDGEVYVAVLSKTEDGSSLGFMNADGAIEAWDGTIPGLGANIVATPLADVYNIVVFSGNLAAGTHRVALAYATADGPIIYSPKALIITVTEE